jgi:phytoene dehydrogenase-like protein
MITRVDELPTCRAVLFDLTPRQMMHIIGGIETTAGANPTGNHLPESGLLPTSYRRRLERFHYGMGVCKLDFALSVPIPWQNPAVARAATVHLGGTLEEIFTSEQANSRGEHAERPFVLLAQQSLFDPSRAPQDEPAPRHTAWAYCHVPSGSAIDVTARIEAQIERFSPGFRDTILARRTYTADQMEAYNPNYIGGDINGGAQDLFQFFTRPLPNLSSYTTPLKGVYIYSFSTSPGGGVHGMCGFHAANAAIRDMFDVLEGFS